jgi:acetyl esterase
VTLDPQAASFLNAINQMPALPPNDDSLIMLRAGFGMMLAAGAGPLPEMASITDHDADGVPIRVYAPSSARDLPIVVYFHGGGWTIGSAPEFDYLAQQVAAAANVLVVSVDYRLAPEHPFPCGLEDAWHALRYTAKHASELGGDGSRLAVMGDSAGGNLSAVCAIQARDAGGPELALQVLIYPATNCSFDTESFHENRTGFLLEEQTMRWFYECYTRGDADPTDWRISPLQARDLHDVAPALVITAEYDPLRDEGEAYARRLQDAGVAVTKHRYDGMIHQFFAMSGVFDAGREAVQSVATALQRAFGTLPV